jgi:hypothetical protein
LHFIGRVDRQVKLHGTRLELEGASIPVVMNGGSPGINASWRAWRSFGGEPFDRHLQVEVPRDVVERIGYDGRTGKVSIRVRTSGNVLQDKAAGRDSHVSTTTELAYILPVAAHRKRSGEANPDRLQEMPISTPAGPRVPRIARLLALALRFEGLIREGAVPDYAALAHAGHVSRARMSQIVKLLGLAPDLQERILFLPENSRLNERNLREIVRQVDWSEQRRLFGQLVKQGKQ